MMRTTLSTRGAQTISESVRTIRLLPLRFYGELCRRRPLRLNPHFALLIDGFGDRQQLRTVDLCGDRVAEAVLGPGEGGGVLALHEAEEIGRASCRERVWVS